MSEPADKLQLAEEVMRRWLRRMPGCHFASHIAAPAQQAVWMQIYERALERQDVAEISANLLEAARKDAALVVLVTSLRTADDIASMLGTLVQDERWRCCLRGLDEAGACAVEVTWQTEHGARSRAMGFAPLASMPITRRAPFVGFALWTGSHDANPFFTPSTQRFVGFANMPPGVSNKEEHDKKWLDSAREFQAMTGLDPETAGLRKVAFCLDLPPERWSFLTP